MIVAAPADERERDLLAGMLADEPFGSPNQTGVEPSTQAAVGGDDEEVEVLLLAGSHEGVREGLALDGEVL